MLAASCASPFNECAVKCTGDFSVTKKTSVCHRIVSYQNLESLHLLKLGGAEDEVALAVTCDSLVIGHILPHINTPEGLNYQATKTYP